MKLRNFLVLFIIVLSLCIEIVYADTNTTNISSKIIENQIKQKESISWIESLNNSSGAISAIATIVLGIITAYYTFLVYATLNEMRKTREVEFIEKRLQQLYYPLKESLDSASDWIIDHREEEQLNSSIDMVGTTLNDIRIYKYLYSTELRNLAQEFIQSHRKHHSGNKDFDGLISLINRMKELTNIDIDKFHKRLDKIVL